MKQAVILAGGKGTRLKPFTTLIPKPLVPIDDIPILEVVLRQLKYYGFTRIVLSVNHLSELIMAFFGDGKKYGMEITYCQEDHPLGTAGSLSIIDNLDENFIVMNGDLLTTINFNDLYEAHIQNQNAVTISSFEKQIPIDLGVLKFENDLFIDYIEKPTMKFWVSMGIYMMHRDVITQIPKSQKLDMPDFMLKLKAAGQKIGIYRDDYLWLDIGRVDDYETAVELFRAKRTEFLKT